MSLISAHLEQISLSCQGIDSLPFPPPKIFTNALLSSHDITSLIRDTEAHERALFSVPPPPPPPPSSSSAPAAAAAVAAAATSSSSSRRQTVFNVAAGEVTTGPPSTRGPRRHTAVAAVLGGDLHAQIARPRGEVDVEVLLRGAERLCSVYALPGAPARIAALRQRYAHQSNTLAYYEARVAEQASRLEGMNRGWMGEEEDEEDEDDDDDDDKADEGGGDAMTENDLRREEDEVRELEKKKRELQERLTTMGKDLGGLLNMQR